MRKWANLTNTGELCIEKVLIELGFPLLFVCVDKRSRRYLVMCIDDENLEYLFVHVKKSELAQFLSTGRGLKKIFIKKGKKIRRVTLTESLDDLIVERSKIDENMLPRKNVKYDFSDNDIVEYLRKLKLNISPTKQTLCPTIPRADLIMTSPAYRPIRTSKKSLKVATAKKSEPCKSKQEKESVYRKSKKGARDQT